MKKFHIALVSAGFAFKIISFIAKRVINIRTLDRKDMIKKILIIMIIVEITIYQYINF